MKHCPECNFSFPDIHNVCDFDGTELIHDPERPSLAKTSPRPSRSRRFLKSPMFLTTLAMLTLFLSAVLIGYLDSAREIAPIVKEQPAAPSLSVASAPEQSSIQTKTPLRRKANIQRQTTGTRSLARVRQSSSERYRASKPEIAAQKNRRQVSEEKDPKLVAILKTTWNVLKKPFKF